jgi:hypothetical protein
MKTCKSTASVVLAISGGDFPSASLGMISNEIFFLSKCFL